MRRRAAFVLFLACAWLSQAQAFAFAQTPAVTEPIQRCDYASGDRPAPVRHVLFPDGDLFRPPLADPKEPRSGFDFRGGHATDPDDPPGKPAAYTAGVAAGGTIGVWARKTSACHGVQISLVGGIFSQFNMDAPSWDLINSDFVVGVQMSARTNRVSIRIRLFHQSSHLGEDTRRENPPMPDPNFGFHALEGLISFDGERWRAYGGGGYLQFMNNEGESALIHAGAEYRAHRVIHAQSRPVAGVDVTSLQSRSWGLTTVANGGLEWASPAETRRMRLVAVFTSGYSPYGQATLERKANSIGGQFQIEF